MELTSAGETKEGDGPEGDVGLMTAGVMATDIWLSADRMVEPSSRRAGVAESLSLSDGLEGRDT